MAGCVQPSALAQQLHERSIVQLHLTDSSRRGRQTFAWRCRKPAASLRNSFSSRENRQAGIYCVATPSAREAKTDLINFKSFQAGEETIISERVLQSDIKVTTMNIWAPIYRRLGSEKDRESQHKEMWLDRHTRIVQELVSLNSCIICLQEFWIDNPEFAALYEKALETAGYATFVLSRTNNRGDGLLAAVKMDQLRVKHYHELQFNDCGDRVAQILWLRADVNSSGGGEMIKATQDLILVNTHLLFPHDAASSLVRIREVFKLLEHLEVYQKWHCKHPTPVVLCGDFNGTKRGEVFKFLRSQGFISSFDSKHEISDSEQGWVSHKNHHGAICGVDYIWFVNPTEQQPLAANWQTAVFRFLKLKLDSAGLTESDQIFKFFCKGGEDEAEESLPVQGVDSSIPSEGSQQKNVEDMTISMAAFQSAIQEVGKEMELTVTEMQELMDFADTDSNGVVDYEEFRTILGRISSWEAARIPQEVAVGQRSILYGFPSKEESDKMAAPEEAWVTVRSSRLFPKVMEQGVWPEDYTLSDHAILTSRLRFHLIQGAQEQV